MCGIAGVSYKDGRSADPGLIKQMTNRLRHRGPDAEGIFTEGSVGLGHRRLKIIDLEGGKQPLYNEDESVVVVFNGEIYNFREVQSDLEARGHTFKTHSDTEVIVHAYEEYGKNCPKMLQGMFAFAIYDRKNRELFLARDRVGIKPLYYFENEKKLIFASEIKPILNAMPFRPSANQSMLDLYMSVGYVPGQETLFAGVLKLLPGHTLTLRGGESKIEKYWDLPDVSDDAMSFEEAESRFEDLLSGCIRSHLMSDVPLGSFLSGGLDSSAVVALMSEQIKDPVKTFSVGYDDDPESSELSYAQIVAKKFKTEHHEYVLRPHDFFESIDLLLNHSEEPVVESAAVALFLLSKLAREHVTVILSGEGADEALAGYPLHQIMPKVDRLHRMIGWMPGSMLGLMGKAFQSEKYMKYWDWASQPLSERYQSISNDVTLSIKKRFYKEAAQLARHSATQEYFQGLFEELSRGSDLKRMSYVDMKSWLPDDILLKADKMTMANSLELRVPFLDHRLLEFCLALPDSYRLRGNVGKHLLRKVMEKRLPHEIIHRKKKGFTVPIAVWFQGQLYEKAREILLDRRSTGRGYFKPEYLEHILKRHKEGKENLSRRIFMLLALEMWHRKYIDAQG